MNTQPNDHIVKSYDEEQRRIVAEIVRMGETAVAQLEAALDVVERRDDKAAQRIIANDEAIDAIEHQVSHDVMHLALRGPMARDLREILAGLRIQGVNQKRVLDETVEWALKSAALWDEVKDRLHESALGLSGGQQQRLVIARTVAVQPEVLLLDEPCSALDPISTLKVEELIYELKSKYTIVIVTHNMQQAARVSDYTAFMYMGKLIEFGDTDTLFTNPAKKQTEDYITGRYG